MFATVDLTEVVFLFVGVLFLGMAIAFFAIRNGVNDAKERREKERQEGPPPYGQV